MSLKITDYSPKFEFTSSNFFTLDAQTFIEAAAELKDAVDAGLSPRAKVEILPNGGAMSRVVASSGGNATQRRTDEETE